jgi:hypothetical protein
MLGVTVFGLLFTPTFYAVVRSVGRKRSAVAPAAVPAAALIPDLSIYQAKR